MPARRRLRVSLRVMWLSHPNQEIVEIKVTFNDAPSCKSLSSTVTAFCEVLASLASSILRCKVAHWTKASLLSCGIP